MTIQHFVLILVLHHTAFADGDDGYKSRHIPGDPIGITAVYFNSLDLCRGAGFRLGNEYKDEFTYITWDCVPTEEKHKATR